MKPYLFRKIIFAILLFSFLIPSLAEAITIVNPLTASTFEELIENLVDFIFWVAVAITPIMIIVAGFYFITSAGNPDKIKTAKKLILYTVIGFTIVLLAKGIISVVRQIVGG